MSSLIYLKKTIDSKNKVSPYEESNLPKKRLSRIYKQSANSEFAKLGHF